MMYKKVFLLILLFVIILATFIISQKFHCSRISCIDFTGHNRYKVSEVYEESQHIYRALYKDNDKLLRVEVQPDFSEDESKNVIQSQVVRLDGMFDDAPAPYPGQLSDTISCGDQYKPVYTTKIQNGVKFSYFDGFVNNRLVFGACSNDQIAYHDTLTMFYCSKQKKLYKLEFMVPNNEYEKDSRHYRQILDSISCR